MKQEGQMIVGYARTSTIEHEARYIIAWKLCTTMKAEDVTATLDLALRTSGLGQGRAPAAALVG